MIAKELIVGELPPLAPSDSASLALDLMDEFKVSHLAVVENGTLLGLVAESDLLDLDSPEEAIKQCPDQLFSTSVSEYDHIFDVVKLVADHRLTVIPVANEKQHFIGSISIAKLMTIIADLPMVSNPGGIIVLEMGIHDYSMTEIARMVENNDAKLLGTYVTSHPDSTMMQVTLKINRLDIQAILQTFDRFGYTVTASYDQGDRQEDLKDRFDLLMNYLNM